jgi:hypothetical protein
MSKKYNTKPADEQAPTITPWPWDEVFQGPEAEAAEKERQARTDWKEIFAEMDRIDRRVQQRSRAEQQHGDIKPQPYDIYAEIEEQYRTYKPRYKKPGCGTPIFYDDTPIADEDILI